MLQRKLEHATHIYILVHVLVTIALNINISVQSSRVVTNKSLTFSSFADPVFAFVAVVVALDFDLALHAASVYGTINTSLCRHISEHAL